MLDSSNIWSAQIFEAIAKALRETNDGTENDCMTAVVGAVRAISRTETLDINCDLDPRGLIPVPDAQIIKDIAYMFKCCLELLNKGLEV